MFVPIRIIIRQYFPQLLLSTNSEKKTSYLDVDVVIKKKRFVFTIRFYIKKKRQERGNHEPLLSLRRPGSAEQAQFFSVFRSNGGKREASVKCESRSRGGVKKNKIKQNKTPVPRRTGAIFCVFTTNRGK